jgi:hypothetical protein
LRFPASPLNHRELWRFEATMKNLTNTARALACAAIILPVAALAAGEPDQHVRGTISAITATTLTVATPTGPVNVIFGAKTAVVGVVPATAADIKPGTFIGTANVPGAARALEVVVFPKAMAGTGEGDYAWDLPAGGKKTSTMTNGTVAMSGGKHSMMTNATVKSMSGGTMKSVMLTYKGGTKTVSIPDNAPIVRVVPGTKALLAKGAHIVAFPGKNAGAVPFIVVGEKGVVPPM